MTKDSIFKVREDFLKKLLYEIVRESEISKELIFKGWTSLMMFYWLQRFSEDLDFNYFNLDLNKVSKLFDSLNYKYTVEKTDIWQRFIVKYWDFNCIVDFAKYKYRTQPEYEVKNINWASLKVFNLPQNFAHKLCAFYERKKGRDVYDINYYFKKSVIPDKNILLERHGRNFSFFVRELLVEINKPYLEKNIDNALKNLDYWSISLDNFKLEIFSNLSQNYLNKWFNFNILYKNQLKDDQKLISLTNEYTLLNKWSIFNPKVKCDYAIMSKRWDVVYETNTIDKMNTFIYSKILEENLKVIDSYKINKSLFWFKL